MDYRQNEVLKLENNPELNIGNVTSVNLTILNGGVQSNVIPPLLTAVFDVRLAIDVDHTTFEAMVSLYIIHYNVAFQHKTNSGRQIYQHFDLSFQYVDKSLVR